MKLLTNNLESELFKVLKMAKEKLIIISPFMNLSITGELVEIVNNNSIHCTVITRFERKAFIENAHSLDALRKLLSNGVEVLALQNLHSKIYLLDDQQCFAGSANFTTKGLTINHEILMHFDNQEVDQFNKYVNQLLVDIKQSGDWLITLAQIETEEQIVNSYKKHFKEDKRLNNSWGADINTPTSPDENSLVLSVSAGDTVHLIEKYLVHAHPFLLKGYIYKPTNYLTFRKAKGGEMDTIYTINKKFSLDMDNWEKEIEGINLTTTEKENLIKYILGRYRDFEFNKAPQYKFYLLSVLCELPNAPHPPANNSGGWIYTLKDLKESKDIVYTVNKSRT
ncbi:phospholipase D family protein [Lysinibacillus fusiformis]|uniref:phospholipase D family protein n=1 Tax=Lysinibacillus fusiformis TaxID=28031 RepID=UPI0000F39BFA|nr:phospholipase D family protein [Lysinibacillus fusiformis]EAZ83605.1 hypothetical protein BB14905_05393 [Bacillus sp. B14905]MED4075362.1 phospholipase D family protein [Lysinibacillus fusiformis]